jgi:radical SAM superfamily enzyme YgiQ (UPF0313 family)
MPVGLRQPGDPDHRRPDCEFCDIMCCSGAGRPKPIDRVVDDSDARGRYGVDSIFFTDDNFIGNRRGCQGPFGPMFFPQGDQDQLNFYTQVSLNLALDQELVDLMVEAGFNRVFIGMKARKDSLLEANKRHNKAAATSSKASGRSKIGTRRSGRHDRRLR